MCDTRTCLLHLCLTAELRTVSACHTLSGRSSRLFVFVVLCVTPPSLSRANRFPPTSAFRTSYDGFTALLNTLLSTRNPPPTCALFLPCSSFHTNTQVSSHFGLQDQL
jgi:hypothetical protein